MGKWTSNDDGDDDNDDHHKKDDEDGDDNNNGDDENDSDNGDDNVDNKGDDDNGELIYIDLWLWFHVAEVIPAIWGPTNVIMLTRSTSALHRWQFSARPSAPSEVTLSL